VERREGKKGGEKKRKKERKKERRGVKERRSVTWRAAGRDCVR
jgi:hypothetical protein